MSQTLPHPDSYMRGLLMLGRFRGIRDIPHMSIEGQRNTLITEMAGRTKESGEHYQGLPTHRLIDAVAALVFLRETGSRNDEELRGMSDDDIRNILIVETHALGGGPASILQRMRSLDIVLTALGRSILGLTLPPVLIDHEGEGANPVPGD